MVTSPAQWTGVAQLRASSERFWERGQLLNELVAPEGLYPRRRTLESPNASELRTRFTEVKQWVTELHAGARHYRIESKSIGHQSIGANDVPQAVWFDSVDEEIAFISKRQQANEFKRLAANLLTAESELNSWALARPFQLLTLGSEAMVVAKVARWIVDHPESNIYLRQLPLAGVHTKFVEKHIRFIDEMAATLNGLAPSRSNSMKSFKARYGFTLEPDTVRLRGLPQVLGVPGGAEDIEITAQSFAAMKPAVSTIVVTENKTNFLAMPLMPETLVVFGAGYGLDGLKDTAWVKDCDIVYWGDIDTHGFAILNRLRSHHHHVRSVLMDRETLEEHREFWGVEDKQSHAQLDYLTTYEAELLGSLRSGADGEQLRLEQEQINWQYAVEKITAACGWIR